MRSWASRPLRGKGRGREEKGPYWPAVFSSAAVVVSVSAEGEEERVERAAVARVAEQTAEVFAEDYEGEEWAWPGEAEDAPDSGRPAAAPGRKAAEERHEKQMGGRSRIRSS